MVDHARKPISLPEGWRRKLKEVALLDWTYGTDEEFFADDPTISRKTIKRAENSGKMTETSALVLCKKLGYGSIDDLLGALGGNSGSPLTVSDAHFQTDLRPATAKAGKTILPSIVLTTQQDTPQWTNFREIELKGNYLHRLSCSIVTGSPYFRFGFKLLSKSSSRIFGDASIKSMDVNLIVHIGRNNYDRVNLGISAHDIFFTSSQNGVSTEKDRKLFSSEKRASVSLKLTIGSGYLLKFFANEICCLSRVIPPDISRRVVMLAWGDTEEYEVVVQDLEVTTAKML